MYRINWGVIGTITWFLGLGIFCLYNGYKLPKDINSLGDALAGIVAPMAFLWLVLGYRQQGKQLEQNTKALKQQEKALQLQIEEMKESVEQQTRLADMQKQQFMAMLNAANGEIGIISKEIRVQPCKDIVNDTSENLYTLILEIQAQINDLRNINIEINSTLYEKINFLKTDSQHICEIHLHEFNFQGDINQFLKDEIDECICKLIIRYQNIYGAEKRNEYVFKFTRKGEQIQITQPKW